MLLTSWYAWTSLLRICSISLNDMSAFWSVVSTSAGFTSPPVTSCSTAASACCCIVFTWSSASSSTVLNGAWPAGSVQDVPALDQLALGGASGASGGGRL